MMKMRPWLNSSFITNTTRSNARRLSPPGMGFPARFVAEVPLRPVSSVAIRPGGKSMRMTPTMPSLFFPVSSPTERMSSESRSYWFPDQTWKVQPFG